jgi:hypothetical protein
MAMKDMMKSAKQRMKRDDVEQLRTGLPIDMSLSERLHTLSIRQGKLTGVLLDMAVKEYLIKHEK